MSWRWPWRWRTNGGDHVEVAEAEAHVAQLEERAANVGRRLLEDPWAGWVLDAIHRPPPPPGGRHAR